MSILITVKATSITVSNGSLVMDLLVPLFNLLTFEDEYSEETKTLGFLYDEETDTIFLHKGVDLDYLVRLIGNDCEIRYDLYDEFKEMEFEYEEIIAPRNDEQVDVINFITGQQDHASNIEASQIFLVKQPGFGKAEPYSSKIPTPMVKEVNSTAYSLHDKEFKPHPIKYKYNPGFINMGDIKVGDYVFDRHGKPTEVLKIFEYGEQDIYQLTFEDGRTARCTLDHMWALYVDDKEKFSTYILGEDMITMFNEGHKLYVPTCKHPVQYEDVNMYIGTEDMFETTKANYLYSSPARAGDFLNATLQTAKPATDKGIYYKSYYVPDNEFQQNRVDKHINETILPLLYSQGFSATYKEHVLYYWKSNKLKIVDIKKLDYKENCRCILVDNPEHLYLTDDYIVTHNTYCSGVGLCKYGVKTLIIMHRDQLRVQWMNSLYKMNGLNSSYVHEIDSSEELYEIATGEYKPNYDVYLMTHATFRAGLKRIGSMKLAMNIGKNLGIGLKIIDEAHLEFKDTILMDFIFNVKRNLYLTATDGRSSKDENSIFRHVFSNCVYYKPSAMLTDNRPKKWVNYYGVEVNTHVNKNIYRYRVVGSKSMTPASYGQWVIKRDKTLQHFKCCRDIVKMLFKEDQYAKLIIFMPLIDLCEECAYFLTMELQKDPEFPYDVDIRTINSKNSKKDNELAKHSDIIVTTIGSCGTGTDIPGITGIISCSPFCSKIVASQVFGRIRYCGKICSYYDIWDSSVPMDKYWYQSRKRTLGHLALNVRELSWSDDTSNEQQP